MIFRFKPKFPLVEINPLMNTNACRSGDLCQSHLKTINNALQKYITNGKPFRTQVVSALLSIPISLEEYVQRMRKIHKGNAVREVIKAEKKGYTFDVFHVQNHVVDLVEINHSKEFRQGRKMTKSYQNDVEHYGGLPDKIKTVKPPDCPLHFYQWMGVFKSDKRHAQGSLLVGRKLVGYINLIRHGNLILYGSILGHGDFLNDGIMYFLNQKTLEWVMAKDTPEKQGINYIMYAGWFDGTEGLKKWKKRTLFSPFYLRILA